MDKGGRGVPRPQTGRSIDVSVVIVTITLAIVIDAVITTVLTTALQCFSDVSL